MSAGLKPVRQGAMDGLCAVYAVLNACRLLGVTGNSRISKEARLDQTKRLFRALCLSDETRALFPDIVCSGVHEAGLEKLLHVAQHWAARHSTVDLSIEQPPLTHIGGASRFFEALRATLTHRRGERKVYILGLAGPCDHWTVVRGVRCQHLQLFDSYDFPSPHRNWAHFSEFTFDRYAEGVSSRRRHVIDARASYLLTARSR